MNRKGERVDSDIQGKIKMFKDLYMKKWILLLLAVFICTAGFADRKKKNTTPEQILSEERQVEFDYCYMEGQ